MSLWILGGVALSVWAMLSIVGNEHVRRTRELEKKYVLPPLPAAPPEEEEHDPDELVVTEAPLPKPH